ncbi:MAG: hypothetical protein QM487_00815 [Candidatus Marithrix sp.]
MNFVSDFFLHSTFAAIVAIILFTIPGLGVLRLLGLMNRRYLLSTFLVAPALGLCTYGPFSLAITTLIGYSTINLIITWLLFHGIILAWKNQNSTISFCEISNKYSLLLLIGMALWAVIPTINIFPALYQDGLFVNDRIFDHAKVALVDAIAREGMLPINPYYAPNGETIPLIYYYTWHFLASQIKLIANVTGWQAEVAFNWFTGFATISFLSALAIRITKRAITGILLLLFALVGPTSDLLSLLLGPRWEYLVGYPPVHGLEVLWLQMGWVPQHVFSALALVVLLFIVNQVLISKTFQARYAIVAGLCAAAAFGSSTWVGGIGFVFVLPFVIGTAFWLRLPSFNYFNTLKIGLLAIFICVLFALPLLISQASGPSLTESELPFGLGLYIATRLISKDSFLGYIAHIILFWLQFLPLNLGITFILGSLAMISYSSSKLEKRTFQALSIGATFGFLLITQFVQSTFWNNTFGWRTVLVPVMLLMVWSAIMLTELITDHSMTQWQPRVFLERWRPMLFTIVVIGLTIGILSSLRLWQWPDPSYNPPNAEVLAQHQGFLLQQEAWAKVREYAGTKDKVQANPDGYADLTPWPATLPYALFADRATAYANPEYATVFAYRYDQTEREQQYHLIQNIFSDHPNIESIRIAHDVLKIKVLLVDKFDRVWDNDAIEKSGLYDLVYKTIDFKIYVTK